MSHLTVGAGILPAEAALAAQRGSDRGHSTSSEGQSVDLRSWFERLLEPTKEELAQEAFERSIRTYGCTPRTAAVIPILPRGST